MNSEWRLLPRLGRGGTEETGDGVCCRVGEQTLQWERGKKEVTGGRQGPENFMSM